LFWHNCYVSGFDLISPESFAHPAKMSPSLCFRILEHLQEMGLLNNDSVILDPMSGTGMTAICAGAKGYRAVTCELEDKFVAFQHQNKGYAERKLYHPLDWTILQGDSRKLSELLTERGLVTVSSPPYGEAMASEKCGIDFAKSKPDYPGRQMHEGRIKQHKERSDNMNYGEGAENIGNLPDRPLKSVMSPPYSEATHHSDANNEPEKYKWFVGRKARVAGTAGESNNNIGSLPDKPLKTVTSPPYEDMEKRDRSTDSTFREDREKTHAGGSIKMQRGYQAAAAENIGMQDKETYLEAMKVVYQEIAKVSDVLAIVLKNPTRNGKLRRLDLDTIKLLEDTGWTIHCQHRALLFEELEQGHMFTGSQMKVKGRMSFFKRLSWQKGQPVASWEDVLIAVRKS